MLGNIVGGKGFALIFTLMKRNHSLLDNSLS